MLHLQIKTAQILSHILSHEGKGSGTTEKGLVVANRVKRGGGVGNYRELTEMRGDN